MDFYVIYLGPIIPKFYGLKLTGVIFGGKRLRRYTELKINIPVLSFAF